MKNEKSYLGRNPYHAKLAIKAVLACAEVLVGDVAAYDICSYILSDICGESISVHTEAEIWDTLQELSEEGYF